MFDILFKHTLKPVCLLLLFETWSCGGADTRVIRRNHESFTLATMEEEKKETATLEKLVMETIKKKLIQKGYTYKQPDEHSDMKVVTKCQTKLEENFYIRLDVDLDVYETYTNKTLWSVSASNMVRSQNVAAEIIEPIVRQLTIQIPYSASVGGVGVVLGRDLKIRDFSPSSPARDAGLKVNDLIVKVDRKRIRELDMCQTMLKGEVDAPVELCVKRGDQELNFTVNRIPLSQMYEKNNTVKKLRNKNLEEDFRRRILQQP